MKTIRGLCCLMIACLILTFRVYGAEESLQDSFRTEWDVFVQSVPEEMRPLAEEALYSSDAGAAIQETFSVSYFLTNITDGLRDIWPSAAGLLLSLMGYLIFSALFHKLRAAVSSETLGAAGELCSTLCLVLCVTPTIQSSLQISERFLDLLTACTGGIAPVICALLVSCGHITTAAVTNASLMLVYTLFQSVIRVFLLPIIHATYVMGMVGNIGGFLHLDSIGRWIRHLFTWLLSLLLLFLSVVIGVQNTVAVNTDSFTMKSAKFALGNLIPLVGNALADAAGTVAGSISMIKNSCGVLGILAVAVLLLPVMLHLLLHRTVIGAARGMAELLGCEREGRLLGEVHASMGYLLAVVSLVSALFVFVLALIISIRF